MNLSLKDIFAQSFYLDKRALAIARILFGIIILVDLISRAAYLEAHYTDRGVLPLSLLFREEWHQFYLSVNTFSGSVEWQTFLFFIQGLAALAMILGYKTRAATAISWLLLVSLHNRNPLILNSGDVYLRMMLLWACFLPWGACYSVDRYRKGSSSNMIASLSSAAFILQIMLVYLMTAMLKHSNEWFPDGTALYYALSLDQMVKPLGKYLLQFPELLQTLTFGTLILEILTPFMLIIPLRNTLFRSAAILALIGLHAGIESTMEVGLFSFISIATLVALTPSAVMDRWENFLMDRISLAYSSGTNTQALSASRYAGSKLLRVSQKITVGFLIGYTVIWNVQTLSVSPLWLDIKDQPIAQIFRIDQKWAMFAPRIFKEDGWFIMKGVLSNGSEVDLFQKRKINWTKPHDMLAYYKSERWRKYFKHIYNKDSDVYYRALALMLKRKWQKAGSQKIRQFSFIYMLEITPPPGKDGSIKPEQKFKISYK